MRLASLRRHALFAVITTVVLIAPVGLGGGSAQAVPAAFEQSSTTSSSNAKAKQLAKAKKVAKAERKVKRLKRKQARSAKARAHLLVEQEHGWGHRQWRCLNRLWERESGWRVKAKNRYSGAYGIPQALPGHKMGKGWKKSARTQVRWGVRYIADRWDRPCKAERHQQRRGWY